MLGNIGGRFQTGGDLAKITVLERGDLADAFGVEGLETLIQRHGAVAQQGHTLGQGGYAILEGEDTVCQLCCTLAE